MSEEFKQKIRSALKTASETARQRLSKIEMDVDKRLILKYCITTKTRAISYHQPEKYSPPQIKTLVDTIGREAFIEVLRSLEDKGIARLNPDLKFGSRFLPSWLFGTRCGYEIDMEKAKEAYNSLSRQKP